MIGDLFRYLVVFFLCIIAIFEGTASQLLKDDISTENFPNIPHNEFVALESFYNSTNGVFWNWNNNQSVIPYNFNISGHTNHTLPSHNDSLVSDVGVAWNFTGSHNPCSENWQGLSCNCTLTQCYIGVIDLPHFNVSGDLPSSISEFTHLRALKLFDNHLNGTIPLALTQLHQLQSLTLSRNHFFGTIPESLSNLTGLQQLQLEMNMLTGTVPAALGCLSSLSVLVLSLNSLNGTIPPELASLGNMSDLRLSNNTLSGTIPLGLLDLRLRVLDLSDNHLTGPLVPELGNLTEVRFLILSINRFNGTVPEQLGRLTKLAFLGLDSNLLTGSLSPAMFVNLTRLNRLWVERNWLTGPIPHTVGHLPTINDISLSHNLFSGQVPESFYHNLSTLTTLYLEENLLSGPFHVMTGSPHIVEISLFGNQFSGHIPDFSSAQSPHLYYFDLYTNAFTGTVPTHVGDLSALSLFDAGANLLTGTIPSSVAHSTALLYFYLNENLLEGSIPAELGQTPSLLVFVWMYSNLLTGRIPEGLGAIESLVELDLNFNLLTGPIPSSFGNLWRLQQLFLDNNLLTGSLSFLETLDPAVSQLTTLSATNNLLTGTISAKVFEVRSLLSFAVSTNCFHGSIPEDICNCSSLSVLVMDGLSTAATCQKRIFPAYMPMLTSYTLQHSVANRFPQCLLTMPRLQTLHLSGNGMSGSLSGSDLRISPSLLSLSLSHNLLTGTVPLALQTRLWTDLDLSFNKLTGELSSAFHAPQANSSLSLQVNLLSGRIPSSLQAAAQISLLDGNMFECSADRAQLPVHDPQTDIYQCGSDAFNQSAYTYVAALCVILLLCAALIVVLAAERRSSRLWVSVAAERCRRLGSRLRDWMNEYGAVRQQQSGDSNSSSAENTDTVAEFGRFSHSLRKTCLQITGYIVLVLMPVYAGLSQRFNTYQHEYAWVVSAAYLAGRTTTAVLMAVFLLFFLVLMLSLWWTIRRQLDKNIKSDGSKPRRTAGQVLNLALMLLVDVAVMVPINVAYVYISVHYPLMVVEAAQLCLAVAKILWNDVVLQRALRWTKSFAAATVKESETVGSAQQQGGRRSHGRDITFVVFLVLLNNIVIPCMAIAAVSSDCFYNVLVPPPDVNATYEVLVCSTYLLTVFGYNCEVESPSQLDISYSPPFIYSFQCSSVIIANYATIYMYMFLIVGFCRPVSDMVFMYCSERLKDSSEDSEKDSEKDGANLIASSPHWLDCLVPTKLRPMSRVSASVSSAGEQCVLFDVQNYTVKVYSYVIILITFGALCPPLAVVTCLSILSFTFHEQLLMGRLLAEARERDLPGFRALIQAEFSTAARHFSRTIWLIVPFASLFYAYFVFDTLGGSVGWRAALWAPATIIAATASIGIGIQIRLRLKCCRLSASHTSSPENAHSGEDCVFGLSGEKAEEQEEGSLQRRGTVLEMTAV